MTDFFVARLDAEGDSAEWVIADSMGGLRSRPLRGSLLQAAAAAGDYPIIVLVPTEDVLTTTVSIPAKSASKLRAALPYALEEDLAEDIENLHFAIGPKLESDRVPVAVVANEKMQDWLARLGAAGIEPERVIPVSHGLAKIPGTLSIMIDDDTIIFNDGAEQEFVMQGVKPSDVLSIAGQLDSESATDAEQTRHLMVFCTRELEQHFLHDWTALRHELSSVDVNILTDGTLPKMATTVASGRGINLLQAGFGKKVEYGALFRPWKAAAALLLGFALVLAVGKGLALKQLINDEAALRAQFTAEYRDVRPNDRQDIVDPLGLVDSFRRSLGGSGAPQVFLPSMAELAKAMAASSAVDVDAVNFRAGITDLRLTAPDVATLDEIQRSVSSSGRFQASIERTDQVADKIEGRIRIREGGS